MPESLGMAASRNASIETPTEFIEMPRSSAGIGNSGVDGIDGLDHVV